MRARWSTGIPGFLVFILTFGAPAAQGGDTESRYRVPRQDLIDIIDAPRPPAVVISPDRQWLLLMDRTYLASIEELSEPELALAGRRIKPRTDSPSRTRPAYNLTFLEIRSGLRRPVAGLPEKPRLENASWSPDGSRVAFTQTTREGVELWVSDLETGEARKLTGPVLSTAAGIDPTWLSDSSALLACLIPEDRGEEPEADPVPPGPIIQENLGRKTPAWTFTALLENPHDEALFDYYFTARLARVDLEGAVTLLGEKGIFTNVDPSPDGRFLLVEILHRPFSYLLPSWRFPMRIEVWDSAGRLVRRIADRPLLDAIPNARGSVETGPRSVSWRADAPATLCWAEALDGGDAGREAELRDALYLLAAPFGEEPVLWTRLDSRVRRVTWGTDDLAFIEALWWKTRQSKVWAARPGDPAAPPRVLFDRSYEDRYTDPGDPVLARNRFGRLALLTGAPGQTIYMLGDGASPEGDRPFLDAFDVANDATERLFHSEAPFYERPVTMVDTEAGWILTRRESVEEVPNYFLRNLKTGEMKQLTDQPEPYPQLRGMSKELIRYQRADGLPLSATLYLPPGYRAENGPLPMVFWAYPEEFKDADAAGQITGSPYRFDWVGWSSPLLWLTQGYGVLDDPSMPIIGEGEAQPNDTFIPQLVASAEAAVEEVVRRGVADRHRIAIGGHSYGAFMTANLLAHSDLFAAGLARTGAYNRTLTPFGYQAEERTFWEAPEVYFEMSPFMHAEKIREPLLLIHGQADDNPGTFPMQSERFFAALKGLGGTVRLVMLPHEGHGYRARESALHVLWETQEWLDRYVKNRE